MWIIHVSRIIGLCAMMKIVFALYVFSEYVNSLI